MKTDMQFNTDIMLDYEDQCLITVETIRDEILYLLSPDADELDEYRYEVVSFLLDAHGYFADDDEHFQLVTEVGGSFVTLMQKVKGR